MEKRRISILGDSISTFAGYTPEEAVFYDSYVQWETGVKSVEDTWWMQVIKALDGELGTNHSLAGSMVSGNLSTSAMSYERIDKLGVVYRILFLSAQVVMTGDFVSFQKNLRKRIERCFTE